MTDPKHIEAIVDKACESISEHVDSVRIFVTFHEGGEQATKSFSAGSGNLYAQLGGVKEWVIRQDTFVKADAWMDQQEEREGGE